MKTSIKLTKLEREYILTNAEMNGCISYWCNIIEFHYSNINKPNYRLLSVELEYGDNEPYTKAKIDHETIQKGINLVLQQDGYESIKEAIINDDHDAESTDVIIQFGLFGEHIYA